MRGIVDALMRCNGAVERRRGTGPLNVAGGASDVATTRGSERGGRGVRAREEGGEPWRTRTQISSQDMLTCRMEWWWWWW